MAAFLDCEEYEDIIPHMQVGIIPMSGELKIGENGKLYRFDNSHWEMVRLLDEVIKEDKPKSTFKCKSCGADIIVHEHDTIAKCLYCRRSYQLKGVNYDYEIS